jgi:toxin ParE1/3/4
MKRIVLKKPAAERDLDRIAAHLDEESPNLAIRFLRAADRAFQQLARMPEMGSRWEAGNVPGLRVWPVPRFSKYLVFYLPLANGIDVVRVLHGAQDLDRLLGIES